MLIAPAPGMDHSLGNTNTQELHRQQKRGHSISCNPLIYWRPLVDALRTFFVG